MSDDELRIPIREEIATLRNDVAWIKRAVLGLYALVGTLLIALIASLASGHTAHQTAQSVVHFFT